MPNLDLYKQILGNQTLGQVHKKESDMVMEATWDTDINTRICYLYDYWHDNHKTQLKNLHPENDPDKIAISLKWRRNSAQTLDKDIVSNHIQMKPSQKMNVEYYPNFIEKRYDPYNRNVI